MRKYLIFDSTDLEGWNDVNNRILNAIKQNDKTIIAESYANKRYSVDMTKCCMVINISNSVIMNELTQIEKNSLIEITNNDPFWNR